MQFIIIGVAIAVIAVICAVLYARNYKKSVDEKIGNADAKAREIIDNALKTAESKKNEGLLEIKEESIRTQNDLDREIKERRGEIQASERRIEKKEAKIDKKLEQVEKREAQFVTREAEIEAQRAEVAKLSEQRARERSDADLSLLP